jgi:hypothetical protein
MHWAPAVGNMRKLLYICTRVCDVRDVWFGLLAPVVSAAERNGVGNQVTAMHVAVV